MPEEKKGILDMMVDAITGKAKKEAEAARARAKAEAEAKAKAAAEAKAKAEAEAQAAAAAAAAASASQEAQNVAVPVELHAEPSAPDVLTLDVEAPQQPAGVVADAASAAMTYTVVSGDSLWAIAVKLLGNGARWPEIYEANKAVVGPNPNLIHPGQVLTIPK